MSVHLTIQAGPALAAQMAATAPPRRVHRAEPGPGPIAEDAPPRREPEGSSMPVLLLLLFLAVSLSVFSNQPPIRTETMVRLSSTI